jgi:LacI family transcriptional regulator
VTINHLADALGLTKSTVSRALNNYPDISESTRTRVKAHALRMGYQPLSHAQAIRTGRTRSIGLVLQTSVHDGHRPFLTDFLAGVTQATSAENWTLTVATAHSDHEMLATLERLINERKADGFILPRTMVDDPRVRMLRGAGVPFVLYGRTGDMTGCAWYDILGEEAMAQAVARLAGLRHERIGFVNSDLAYNYAGLRREGFARGMREAGIAPDEQLMLDGVMGAEAGCDAVLRLMRAASPPTAIVFATDMAALGAYRAAERLGLRIGRELSVISYDGAPEGAYADPVLTTFNVDTTQAGRRLTALLIELIRGTPPEDLRESARARLQEGGSDGPPSATSEELARIIGQAFDE